jgi:hypothetical protein
VSRLSPFLREMKRKWERILAQREYRRALQPRHDVANALPDRDEGLYIRGPAPTGGNRAEDYADNPVETGFGRRHTDILADRLITKKLVFVAVFVVEVLCLAGDTLFLRDTSCF